MIWLAIACGALVSASLLLNLVLILRWEDPHSAPPPAIPWPSVSVLLPVRNEEATLRRCLDALLDCDYPVEQLEILVGNDHSEDDTQRIIDEYSQRFGVVRSIQVGENLGNARGKANALAHLAKAATYDLWLLTDADTAVNTRWIKSMVARRAEKQVAIVAGVTLPAPLGWFGTLQRTDYLLAWGMIQQAVEADVGISSAGNNMLITREAYEKVGGYETIPFSVTEDFALYKAVLDAGYTVHHEFTTLSKAETLAETTWGGLLKQRKRWMRGAVQLPITMVLLLGVQAMYYPAVLGITIYLPWLGGVAIATKACIQAWYMSRVARRIDEKITGWELWAYELYSAILSTTMVIYYLWPTRIKWKGRSY